ncbi:MAG TPA: AAA family ATPase, partial [Alphaproteobacteria bacterium]
MPFDSILASAPTGAALVPLDWRDVLAGDQPGRVPLLDPILAPGELALLRGPAGIGKSWLALRLAFAVAQGQTDVLGWRTGRAGRRVLLIDAQ